MPENRTKQVIVIRRDLKMRRGKEIAQGSHASMAFLSRRVQPYVRKPWFSWLKKDKGPVFSAAEIAWLQGSFAKVVLQVQTEQQLMDVHQQAKEAGLESHLITDSGRTEFHGQPTHTAVAIGPDYADKIDEVTGHLQLY